MSNPVILKRIDYHHNMSRIAPTPEMRNIHARHADAERISLAAETLKEIENRRNNQAHERELRALDLKLCIMHHYGMGQP